MKYLKARKFFFSKLCNAEKIFIQYSTSKKLEYKLKKKQNQPTFTINKKLKTKWLKII